MKIRVGVGGCIHPADPPPPRLPEIKSLLACPLYNPVSRNVIYNAEAKQEHICDVSITPAKDAEPTAEQRQINKEGLYGLAFLWDTRTMSISWHPRSSPGQELCTSSRS